MTQLPYYTYVSPPDIFVAAASMHFYAVDNSSSPKEKTKEAFLAYLLVKYKESIEVKESEELPESSLSRWNEIVKSGEAFMDHQEDNKFQKEAVEAWKALNMKAMQTVLNRQNN